MTSRRGGCIVLPALLATLSVLVAAPARGEGAAGAQALPVDAEPLCGVEQPDDTVAASPDDGVLRVAQYNILHSETDDGDQSLARRLPLVADVIVGSGADIVGAEEVTRNLELDAADEYPQKHGLVAQRLAALVAERTGAPWSWCWSLSNPHVPLTPDVFVGGGNPLDQQAAAMGNFPNEGDFSEGLAILSRFPISEPVFRRLLPRSYEAAGCVDADPFCPLDAIFDSRQVLFGRVEVPAGGLDFFVTHLAHHLTELSTTTLNDTPPVVDRMYKALRRYFNNHYETYGREVVFDTITASGESTSDAAMKADAVKIADEMGAFAVFTGNALAPMPTVLASELARRGVICICTTSLSSQFYQEHPPLIWSSLPTINEYAAHSAEYAAKRLGRNKAAFAGPLISNQKRVYCLMVLVGTGTTISPEGPRGRDIVIDAYKKRGLSFAKVVQYFYAPGQNQDDITNMIGQLKSANCTTIVPVVDPIMPILITKEATKQAYFPEWYVMGTGLSDTTTIARFYDQQQWENAFGVSPLWVTWDRVENSSGYNEYHHGNPGGRKGDEGALINVYRAAFQTLWQGIHMAGPTLNNETFEKGMYAYPKTGGSPASPLVYQNRAFPTAIKDFSEIYYDPKLVGPDERSETGAGMIVRPNAGKRYDAGEWPQSPPSRSNAVTVTAQQGNNVGHASDGHTHDKRCLSCSS